MMSTSGLSGHVGLVNCGNTCFLNSVVQMLYHIPEFRQGVLNLSEELRNEEPLLTLYNIFERINNSMILGDPYVDIRDLLTESFECLFFLEGIEDSKNKEFRKIGVQKGYFKPENLKNYGSGVFGEKQIRNNFLDLKLASNISQVQGNNPASIDQQTKLLIEAKEKAAKNIENDLSKVYKSVSGRQQQDAGQFLTQCILSKIDVGNNTIQALYKIFKSDFNTIQRGFYISTENLEGGVTKIGGAVLNNEGIVDGKQVKFKALANYDSIDILIKNISLTNDLMPRNVQSLIDSFEEADVYVPLNPSTFFTGRAGKREFEQLDIVLPDGREIIPLKAETKSVYYIYPEQQYLIFQLSRFIDKKSIVNNRLEYQTLKNNDPVKINKEITFDHLIRDGVRQAGQTTFELEGIIVHPGTVAGGGHYFYIWKEPSTGNWITFDDSSVSSNRVIANEKYLRFQNISIERKAYILLYKKKVGGPTPIRNAAAAEYSVPDFSQASERRKILQIEEAESRMLKTMSSKLTRKLKRAILPKNKNLSSKEENFIQSFARNFNKTFKHLKPKTTIPSLAQLQAELQAEERKTASVQKFKPRVVERKVVSKNEEAAKTLYQELFTKKITIDSILNTNPDILFELVKLAKVTTDKEKSELNKQIRQKIFPLLRIKNKETESTYIYELATDPSWGKGSFIKASKYSKPFIENYTEKNFELNKKRFEKKQAKKGGRKTRRKQ